MASKKTGGGCTLKNDRTAILVIHGIGEQNPYETLDNFARGLFAYLRECGLKVKLEPRQVAHRQWTQIYMRLGHENGWIDLYEYYWAPLTEREITLRQTLGWLMQADLSPLRYLADNLQALTEVTPGGAVHCLRLFVREIGRIALLYLPVAAVVLWLLSRLTAFAPSVGGVPIGPVAVPQLAGYAFYGLALVMALLVFHSVAELVARRGRSVERRAHWTWLISAVVAACGSALLGSVLPGWLASLTDWTGGHAPGRLKALAAAFVPWLKFGAPIYAAAVTFFVAKYVGDIAVYVNADARSQSYEARARILDGATEALAGILRCEDYDHVILAGHSLGSVIAYDTVNELRIRAMAAQSQPSESLLTPRQLEKLHGLVTFGSPLDKIYYFFREHVRENQAIRAQILSMLYSFRKKPSNRDYGEFVFQYNIPGLERLRWLNAWSRLDPVSGRLQFYRVDDQKEFRYWRPVLAHMSYWDDPNFYRFFGTLLVADSGFPEDLSQTAELQTQML